MTSPSFKRVALLVTVVFSALLVAEATQVMHRPENYKNLKFNKVDTSKNFTVHHLEKRASGKVQAAYFTNWGTYAADMQPSNIPVTQLSHLLYSFADTRADSGNIFLTDSFADEQKHYDGDSWDEAGNNLYGCLKQIYLLKMKNRSGWNYAQAGHFNFVTNAQSRTNFVNDAVKIVEDYGFDGIDIDFEYPSDAEQGKGFADLLTQLRTAFNDLQSKKGDSTPYEITVAVAAGASNYQNLVVSQMDSAVSHWHLMAYDYAGSWLTYADHQANLYGGERTGVSTDAAVKWYISQGASANKIVMGMPLYGRAFEDTAGIGQPFNGVGPGTTEAGIYSYKVLPLAGAQVFEVASDVASYSYDSAKKELVSYDTPNIIKTKVQYINSKGLGGAMFWELSTDKTGSDSLVSTSAGALGSLDNTQNHINYPNSKWDNLRQNFGNGGTDPTNPPPPPAGGCNGIATWSATAVYTGTQQAVYNGHIWTAQWWTQNEIPGKSDVWVDAGACYIILSLYFLRCAALRLFIIYLMHSLTT